MRIRISVGGQTLRALAFASTGAGFNVAGAPIARGSALIDTGIDIDINAQAKIGVSYVGRFVDTIQDHAAKGNFRVRF